MNFAERALHTPKGRQEDVSRQVSESRCQCPQQSDGCNLTNCRAICMRGCFIPCLRGPASAASGRVITAAEEDQSPTPCPLLMKTHVYRFANSTKERACKVELQVDMTSRAGDASAVPRLEALSRPYYRRAYLTSQQKAARGTAVARLRRLHLAAICLNQTLIFALSSPVPGPIWPRTS